VSSTSGVPAAPPARSAGIQVIARAGEILRLLGANDRGISLRDVAEATGLPRSTVHRIVLALADEELVSWDPVRGKAEIGTGLVGLALGRGHRLRDTVRPYLETLSRRVDETVDLVLLRGDSVVFVDQVVARQLLVVSAMGAVLPAHATACGKALLSALPQDEVARLLPAQLEACTANTITDRAELLRQLEVIKVSRLAYDHQEQAEGLSAVAALVRNAWGEVAAITIPAPSLRFAGREGALSAALLETCDELDRLLAGR
jgi:DNA-binding IclR family transcriptional regulator